MGFLFIRVGMSVVWTNKSFEYYFERIKLIECWQMFDVDIAKHFQRFYIYYQFYLKLQMQNVYTGVRVE